MHVTSLPGPLGSGDIGEGARRFVDFLADAGQTWWQMLPIGPVGSGFVPYTSTSALATNPLLIDLAALFDQPLRPPGRISETKVNFRTTARYRMNMLRRAYAGFDDHAKLAAYRRREAKWLEDYALFEVLRKAHRQASWIDWPRDLSQREPEVLAEARKRYADEIGFECYCQFVFDQQWRKLRKYAAERGVRLIGDVPIFVDHNSADVWAHRKLFQLDRQGRRRVVAGVPPDPFNARGQVWGSPLYNWPAHRSSHFAWWTRRFTTALKHFDVVRIDHFLGLHRCFAIPAGDRNAKRGQWQTTPGRALLGAVQRAVGNLPLIAEDLGHITPQAAALRDRFHIPGMRVLQWGLGGDAYHLPPAYARRCVAYTGTHDNDTTLGWYRKLPIQAQRRVRVRLNNSSPSRWTDDLIRMLYASGANVVILPIQDALGLNTTARMNRPGTRHGNWTWRLPPGAASPALARRLAHHARIHHRGGARC